MTSLFWTTFLAKNKHPFRNMVNIISPISRGIKPLKNPKIPSVLYISAIEDKIPLKKITIQKYILEIIHLKKTLLIFDRSLKKTGKRTTHFFSIELFLHCLPVLCFTTNELCHHTQGDHLKWMTSNHTSCLSSDFNRSLSP